MADARINSGLALREKAEGFVKTAPLAKAGGLKDLSTLTSKKLVHELQVHQIELEMQNEELMRAHVQLDIAKVRYFNLYDLAPIGYCTLNEQGVVIEANLAAASLLGTPRCGLTSKPLHRFIAKSSQDSYYLCGRALATSKEPQECELQVLQQTNDEHAVAPWVHMRMSSLADSDGLMVLRVVFHDISERKRLEAEMTSKRVELELAWSQADKANRAKADFLSAMTHELRSPLNAILGFAQLLNMGTAALTPTQKSNIQQIEQAGWHLLDLVNEVLDLSLAESGKLAVTLEPVSMTELLLDCQATLELPAKQGIRITYNLQQPDCWLLADKARLKQVCINLVTNAIQYNRPNGSIDVTCTRPFPGTIRFAVVDTGLGLSADQLAQLFLPFNRLGREAQHRDGPGLGIGLAVSKRLVELMHGSMGAKSNVGVGSTFWFELPACDPLRVAHA